MVWAESRLADRQRPLEERLDVAIAAQHPVELAKVVERQRDVRVVRTERCLRHLHRPLRQRHGFGEFSGLIQFLHFPGQSAHLTLLRKRRRNDDASRQRHGHDDAQSLDDVHESPRPRDLPIVRRPANSAWV